MKINKSENMMYNNDVEVISDIGFNKFVQAKLQSSDFRKVIFNFCLIAFYKTIILFLSLHYLLNLLL